MDQHSLPRGMARQMTLAAHPAAVPRVRHLARQLLTEWGVDGLSDTALLLVSELVTNAVQASADGDPAPGGPRPRAEITLTLSLTRAALLIEVWDARSSPARAQLPDATAESGRGLFVVDALASSWGQRAEDGGKVVWCEIGPVPDAAADASSPLGASTVPGPQPTSHHPFQTFELASQVNSRGEGWKIKVDAQPAPPSPCGSNGACAEPGRPVGPGLPAAGTGRSA